MSFNSALENHNNSRISTEWQPWELYVVPPTCLPCLNQSTFFDRISVDDLFAFSYGFSGKKYHLAIACTEKNSITFFYKKKAICYSICQIFNNFFSKHKLHDL